MTEGPHPARAPQDGPQAAVEPLRAAVARSAHKVVGDPLHPVLQRFVELHERLEVPVVLLAGYRILLQRRLTSNRRCKAVPAMKPVASSPTVFRDEVSPVI